MRQQPGRPQARNGGGPAGPAIVWKPRPPISQQLVADFPDKPRYLEELAGTLTNLAAAQAAVDVPEAERTYQTSVSMFEKLVAGHPDNAEYRIGLARCLRSLAPSWQPRSKVKNPKPFTTGHLAVLIPTLRLSRRRRFASAVLVLNNFGDLEIQLKRPEAEKTLGDAIGIFPNAW